MCRTPFVVSLGCRTADLSASNHEQLFDKLRSTILPREGFEANRGNPIFTVSDSRHTLKRWTVVVYSPNPPGWAFSIYN
jgi:hypothetical protein